MSALFRDLDYSSPPKTPPLHFVRSEFSFYDHSHSSSPVQDRHDNLDWASSEQVEFTRLNPSRIKDSTEGEWHMVTATCSLLGSERSSQREDLQACRKLSYSSLPRAHFLQPTGSSAFSPYTNDLWLNCKDAETIADFPRNSPKLQPLTQSGFYSPKIPRSKYCEAAQSTKKVLKGSSTSKMKEYNAYTLPLPSSKTAVLKHSPLCCKPQKVEMSVVKTPPLMRAVISQTSPNSNQPSKKHFSQLQLREDHHFKNQDQSFSSLQVPNIKLPRNDQFVWSPNQQLSSLYQPAQSKEFLTENISIKDHLSINTHLFPERQSGPAHTATVSPSLQKVSQERFNLSVDSGIKLSQGDPDQPQPHASLTQPDGSQKQKNIQYTQHQEDGDVTNCSKDHVKSQVDMNSKNVFGQPRIIASLRAACSPRPVRRSTVLEDLKKLIVMDDTEDGPQSDSQFLQEKEAGLCSSSQMSGCASPLLPSPANQTYPESPALTPTYLSLQTRPTECWAMPEQAESDLWESDQEPELMPLPSTACHLDWNSLVQAAQAYETQKMATLLSEMSPVPSRPETPSQGSYKIHHSNEDDTDDVFIDFPDQFSHLEGMLKRLSSDLLKEKRDKVALLAEVLKLRISNQHLREESLCACAQLHKISKIVNATPEGVE